MKWCNINMKMCNKQHFEFSLRRHPGMGLQTEYFLVAWWPDAIMHGIPSKRSYVYSNTVELGRNLEGF
jgi:hypothetical protein